MSLLINMYSFSITIVSSCCFFFFFIISFSQSISEEDRRAYQAQITTKAKLGTRVPQSRMEITELGETSGSNEGADQLSISIDKKLADLSPSEPNCYFFRVHNQLRKVNAKAYEPEVIAIGPYHPHTDYLYMEEQKLLYFKLLLNRQGKNVNDYVLGTRVPQSRMEITELGETSGSNEGADKVSISIDKKLADLSPSEPNCYFFRVHNQLRKVNAKAYEPEVIAIGPYHRHTDYQYMEEQKLLYFKLLLNREGKNVNDYVLAVRKLEADLRKCYAEPIDLDEDQFVEMMLLDGCFIIELFRKFDMSYFRAEDDPIFRMSWIVNSLQRDLMLFENQVPFIVLEKLFEIITMSNPNHKKLSSLVLRFFSDILPVPKDKKFIEIDGVIWNSKRKHLLSFIHDNWSYKIANKKPVKDENKNWRFIQCATKLREAGIQFEKNESGSLFDIKFANGVMQIPPLTIEGRTETIFRNLIAYEQYSLDVYLKFVTDYVKFMDNIIDTPQDVAILEHHDIIDNWLGGGKAVSSMFNQITDSVTGPGNNFLYAGICVDVKEHCSKRRNRWMEILRANYLNSPWGVISIVGGCILLLLTFAQTLFTVFPRK